MKRDDIGLGYKWATDHLTYVGTLWNEPKLNKRMEGLAKVVAGVDEDGNAKEAGLGIVFRKQVDINSCWLNTNIFRSASTLYYHQTHQSTQNGEHLQSSRLVSAILPRRFSDTL